MKGHNVSFWKQLPWLVTGVVMFTVSVILAVQWWVGILVLAKVMSVLVMFLTGLWLIVRSSSYMTYL